MKKIFYFILVTAITGCFNIVKKQAIDSLTKEEVYTVINAFDKAWESKNAIGVDAVLSPAYTYFTPSGNTFIRDSIVATAGASLYRLSNAERIIIDTRIDGNMAVVNTRWIGIGDYRGVAFNDDQRCSINIIKKDGTVKILSEHCTELKNNAFK